jgi:hypothetical protein
MISCEWWIIKAPVFKIIVVPGGNREIGSEFYPVTLGFEITVKGWRG